MRDRIGDRFEAAINGMSQGGLYVTLDAPAVAVGDRLVVEISGVSLQRRQIEMAVVSKLSG